MPDLVLTMAMSSYDHVRDLVSGAVRAEGIAIRHLELPVEEIFYRFIKWREFDVSEISMAKFSTLMAHGDDSFVGIPVFPSRVFRHSSMYVRADSDLHSPAELRGKRIGIPEWAQTAAVYSRGLLSGEYGVPLTEVAWVQAGVNQPGRREKVAFTLPPGVSCTAVPDRSLDDLLRAGDIDAVFSAHAPESFERAGGGVRRLLADPESAEREYWARTGVHPIMHAVAIRREIVEEHPWVPVTLFKAFEAAKERSIRRVLDYTISSVPVPWLPRYATDTWSQGGQDPWPYGVDANRPTLEAFLGYAHEQGLHDRQLKPGELFSPHVDAGFRI
ncbi:MAG TPA: hypothetical protein VFV41_29505 [Streptosporangiaceae bacterium]|nr:hypothetical protein [Streptosporangiaceae bacterium]